MTTTIIGAFNNEKTDELVFQNPGSGDGAVPGGNVFDGL